MYKKLASVIVSVLLIIALVGCSSSTNANNSGKNIELKMVFWDSNQEIGLKDMAAAFMKKNPNYKISVETIPWDQYWTKLQASAQAGNMPDIVVMHPDEVANYAKGGKLLDLTDMLKNSKVTSIDKFPKFVVDNFTFDGKIYGVPKDIGTLALVYNKDLFDKAGVTYPNDKWTWTDMYNAAAKITNKAKNIYGIATPNDGQNFYWNLVWQNGGDFFTPDRKTSTFDSPENVEAMKYAVSFIKNGYSPTIADFANLTPDQYFESGKVGMMFAGSWMLPQYLSAKNLNFDVAQLPQGKERAAISSGMAFSVAKNTKNPQAALKFVEYLGSKEAQLIQSKAGVAISAYKGTQQPWIDGFTKINAAPFAKVIDYGHTSPGITTNNEASAIVDKYMPDIFSSKIPVDEGLKKIQDGINALK